MLKLSRQYSIETSSMLRSSIQYSMGQVAPLFQLQLELGCGSVEGSFKHFISFTNHVGF